MRARVYNYLVGSLNVSAHFLPKPKNWEGLTVINVRAVKNAVQLLSCKLILRLDKLIKIGISSSAATLKVVIKGF